MNDSVYGQRVYMASEQHFPRVNRKARYAANLRARDWVEANGAEYETKAEAIIAFRDEVLREETGLEHDVWCALGADQQVRAFGFPILATVLSAILCWFVSRWMDRLFPEKG